MGKQKKTGNVPMDAVLSDLRADGRIHTIVNSGTEQDARHSTTTLRVGMPFLSQAMQGWRIEATQGDWHGSVLFTDQITATTAYAKLKKCTSKEEWRGVVLKNGYRG